MGAHTRPRSHAPGRHRGETAPLVDLDLGAAAGKAGAVAGVAGAATALVITGAGIADAAPAHSATPGDFAALRACESGGNYATDTGNGFYGAYQFDLRTWHGLGYRGLPSTAAPSTQDEAAQRLQAARGWEPWPACSRRLGLGSVSHTTNRGTVAPAAHAVSVQVAGAVPAFPGTDLTEAMVDQKRADVLVWQSRMARRGWQIAVDGYFGPQSASIAQQFAAEKHIAVPGGTVNSSAWTAAWTAPITP